VAGLTSDDYPCPFVGYFFPSCPPAPPLYKTATMAGSQNKKWIAPLLLILSILSFILALVLLILIKYK
jgi:hypothetical protein